MIQIINTGVANIRSLQAAFDRLDQPWNLTESPDQIAQAPRVVLPGVGAFSAAVEAIDRLGLRQPIIDRINADQPLLCICLGMQLLCTASEESEGVSGLGIFPFTIRRFEGKLKIPQLGWNDVTPRKPADGQKGMPFETGEAYFANSFRLTDHPDGWGYAETDYGGPFVSSVWRGRVLACQFHPELSGAWGQQLLANWVKGELTC